MPRETCVSWAHQLLLGLGLLVVVSSESSSSSLAFFKRFSSACTVRRPSAPLTIPHLERNSTRQPQTR